MGPTRHLSLKITNSLAIFIEETTENLNQVGRPRHLNPGPPECESRALPRSHLARLKRLARFATPLTTRDTRKLTENERNIDRGTTQSSGKGVNG